MRKFVRIKLFQILKPFITTSVRVR